MSAAVEPAITLVKRIRAAPARVWDAFTRAEAMMVWFGPHHTRAEAAEADPRPGGRFRVVLREDGGARHEVSGRYLAVEPGARLVFDWAWSVAPERVSRVTVAFRDVAEGTEVTVTHDRFADADTATRHVRGWTESLERLAAHLGG
ncbi:SRPBCC family protein [Falsiroseomonas sp. CW058]|uniref:SRPBCC family protein n=1 Tax=Falsiroseomonas sp. CW058 TaxID=3388664 RepID=UPI003D314125